MKKAYEKARKEFEQASDDQKSKYDQKMNDLMLKLKEAEDKNQRAISMAQQTRAGHVYVISNIGSFGEDVLKLGMTRRLEPLDRVRELGDASVPFTFDVHAMIYSDDAPALEKKLHHHFNHERVNKVNYRKEFFKTPLAGVKKYLEDQGIQAKFTLKAEALQYRESLQIELLPEEEQHKIEDAIEEMEAGKVEYVFDGDEE
ncbi:GIY-YIG nuclease family protein [Acinetobacter sp. ANC 3781]